MIRNHLLVTLVLASLLSLSIALIDTRLVDKFSVKAISFGTDSSRWEYADRVSSGFPNVLTAVAVPKGWGINQARNHPDYMLRASPQGDKVLVVLFMTNPGQWRTVQVYCLMSGRPNLIVGDFLNSPIYALAQAEATPRLTYPLSSCELTLPANMLVSSVYVSVTGLRSFASQILEMTLGKPSIVGNRLKVNLTVSQNIDIQYIHIGYIVNLQAHTVVELARPGIEYHYQFSFQSTIVSSSYQDTAYGIQFESIQCIGSKCPSEILESQASCPGIIRDNICFGCGPNEVVKNRKCQCADDYFLSCLGGCIKCKLNEVYDQATRTCVCNSQSSLYEGKCVPIICPTGSIISKDQSGALTCLCTDINYIYRNNACMFRCGANEIYDGTNCICNPTSYKSGSSCVSCPPNSFYNNAPEKCSCPIGQFMMSNAVGCVSPNCPPQSIALGTASGYTCNCTEHGYAYSAGKCILLKPNQIVVGGEIVCDSAVSVSDANGDCACKPSFNADKSTGICKSAQEICKNGFSLTVGKNGFECTCPKLDHVIYKGICLACPALSKPKADGLACVCEVGYTPKGGVCVLKSTSTSVSVVVSGNNGGAVGVGVSSNNGGSSAAVGVTSSNGGAVGVGVSSQNGGSSAAVGVSSNGGAIGVGVASSNGGSSAAAGVTSSNGGSIGIGVASNNGGSSAAAGVSSNGGSIGVGVASSNGGSSAAVGVTLSNGGSIAAVGVSSSNGGSGAAIAISSPSSVNQGSSAAVAVSSSGSQAAIAAASSSGSGSAAAAAAVSGSGTSNGRPTVSGSGTSTVTIVSAGSQNPGTIDGFEGIAIFEDKYSYQPGQGSQEMCPLGEYFSSGLCVSCSAFCNTCQSTTKCTACADGFMLVGGDNGKTSCVDICGDGRRLTTPCDDGNNISGDGCSAKCEIEPGWMCRDFNQKSVCEKTPTSNQLQIIMKGTVLGAGVFYQGVTLVNLPSGMLDPQTGECLYCKDLLVAFISPASSSTKVTITFVERTKFKFVVLISTDNYDTAVTLTVGINSKYSNYFSAYEMNTKGYIMINPVILSRRIERDILDGDSKDPVQSNSKKISGAMLKNIFQSKDSLSNSNDGSSSSDGIIVPVLEQDPRTSVPLEEQSQNSTILLSRRRISGYDRLEASLANNKPSQNSELRTLKKRVTKLHSSVRKLTEQYLNNITQMQNTKDPNAIVEELEVKNANESDSKSSSASRNRKTARSLRSRSNGRD